MEDANRHQEFGSFEALDGVHLVLEFFDCLGRHHRRGQNEMGREPVAR
jgi:hypothetical protein